MKNIVTLNSIKKSYDAHTVLDGVSHVIDENTAIMGASGNGKTTLVRIVMGLERADSGEVSFTQRPRFSVVFQEDRLFEGFGAVENITAIIGRSRENENRATELFCELLIDSSELSKPVRDFSEGMKRRVAVARALLADSNILVLDEPFKGLDEDTRDRTAAVIRKYAEGKLILLVTHDTHEAELLGIEKVISV